MLRFGLFEEDVNKFENCLNLKKGELYLLFGSAPESFLDNCPAVTACAALLTVSVSKMFAQQQQYENTCKAVRI